MLLQNWASERIGAAMKKHSAHTQLQDNLKREEKVYKKMAHKDRKRAPDGLYDIALDLLREEFQLSAVVLDKSKLNQLFSSGNGEMLSIWTSTITEEKVDSCWNDAMELQEEPESSGAEVATEEEDDEARRTCTAPLKKVIRQDMPGEQQGIVKRVLLEQQESLTDSLADLSAYAQGVLLRVGLQCFLVSPS